MTPDLTDPIRLERSHCERVTEDRLYITLCSLDIIYNCTQVTLRTYLDALSLPTRCQLCLKYEHYYERYYFTVATTTGTVIYCTSLRV